MCFRLLHIRLPRWISPSGKGIREIHLLLVIWGLTWRIHDDPTSWETNFMGITYIGKRIMQLGAWSHLIDSSQVLGRNDTTGDQTCYWGRHWSHPQSTHLAIKCIEQCWNLTHVHQVFIISSFTIVRHVGLHISWPSSGSNFYRGKYVNYVTGLVCYRIHFVEA